MDEKKKCKTCNGKKVAKETKQLKVEIDKGAPNGDQYTIHGEGNEIPDVEPGDVVVIMREVPHETFKRRGADLFMEKEITLFEALTGVDFVIKHLDGRKIRIKNNKGDIIKPEDLKTIENQGMPFHKRTFQHGNLIILFKIKFPETISNQQADMIKQALGTGKPERKTSSGKKKGKKEESKNQDEELADEECFLQEFKEWHKNTHHGGGDRGNESDEENGDESHGQRIGCQQQ